MGPTTELRREIEARVVPALAAKGFARDRRRAPLAVTFRRITSDGVHVLDIQWARWGAPRFVVNLGRCGPAGVEELGERLAPEDVFPAHAARVGRLQPRRGSGTAAWFRQDRSLLQRLLGRPRLRPPAEVVSELLALLPEVEAYFEGGAVGPHLSFVEMKGVRDAP